MSLDARIMPQSEVSMESRDQMFALMSRHYENVRRESFEADLAEKDWVILLCEPKTGRLCGFSTQMLLPVSVAGRTIRVVFSGDTIVDREHWGTTSLAIAWGKLASDYIQASPGDERYWFLISKGFRTYRFLPVYFHDYYPRYDSPTPAPIREVIDAIALSKFPAHYELGSGIVRATQTSDRLRRGMGEITPERLRDPHVQFFEQRNPGHWHGDELCCVAPLNHENFTALAQRLIHSRRFCQTACRMMNPPYWFNSVWKWQSQWEYRRFRWSTNNVRRTQESLLLAIVRRNAECRYGREHGFAKIHSLADYQGRVPLTNYEQLRSWIDCIASGESRVLTTEPVLMFEPTGGTSGGTKLIPYTTTLRQQFQRAIAVWMHDLLVGLPGIRRGSAYWSISPAIDRPRRTSGGVRIGFDSDTDYLAGWQRWVMSKLLATPRTVARLRNMENFQYATLAYLLATANLSLISIWSPTFLTALLPRIPDWIARIADDLQRGRLRLPYVADERQPLAWTFPHNPQRARLLTGSFAMHGLTSAFLAECWPRLSLLSAWQDAEAERFVPPLRQWFPSVPFQPKGLLATEGVISFPLLGHPGAALAIRSHYFEFLDPNDSSPSGMLSRGAWELQLHGRYRVLLTTGGGLYRYDLGDEVEVVGFVQQCPLLRFLGRVTSSSDLVGEKLHEQHVRESIRRACEELGIEAGFALLAPVYEHPLHYRAFLAGVDRSKQLFQRTKLELALAERIELRLLENVQYRFAVRSGQLRSLTVSLLSLSGEEAWKLYEEECRQRGQVQGDIKPTVLVSGPGWAERFAACCD